MKFGVVIFPGSNCDQDCIHVLRNVLGCPVKELWHKERDLQGCECIVLPGGFSYGDYLRTGAIARFSPIMESVASHAAAGRPVIGICNGFQILCEAGILPGALIRNQSLRFICKPVHLSVENSRTIFTRFEKKTLAIPIAHGEGNYFIHADGLKRLKENVQIVFRYCDKNGKAAADANPNGSLENIAGIINERGNVLGMMPHPERCSELALGGEDGLNIFKSIIQDGAR
ncbi:MAG TPA: phosphoribosylformylglycinamidine synthase subunit PurQ [Candidatus Sumerlaeota bacterium]|nr:MAG: Phosphoribosylformylglycinamidine synthase 1 [candidate division BRC1 bacterium ADurb.Bin183]HOE63892.1 phosphoribosylformylglycinamidine synthase subunit PurQ [Candidatus Sumerlaeota bacterium]HRR31580.1 phosphoribosylformylglycinamidine synthase subunit PurQ [Candidatus Sumerlaeia bacterium]HON51178.1 phosphoribosylformylglycinamidine synthase subunit PurQ [Candidatus Sumerlaeota bacterium]HOR64505.1 phosphoribosylformylglycinamidine synthase subunit PurQ [Candidatus Sumerlaeota bacte